jgi:hypothetical protein
MKNITTRQAIFWLAIATPVVIHFSLLFLYAVNAPRLDDFSETLFFLSGFSKATDASDKLDWFFSVYRGHRHSLSHLVYLSQQPLDFRFMSILGNLLLLLYTFLFATTFRELSQRKTLLLLAVYLIFNLQAWRGMFWPLATWGTQAVLVLAFASFIFATQHKKITIFPTIFFCTLTSFTYVNGIFVWPIIACYLFLESSNARPPHQKALWILIIAAASTLAFYFHDYQSGNPTVATFLSPQTNIAELLLNIIKGFLAISGSVLLINDIENAWKISLAICIGGLEILLIGWLLLKGSFSKMPALIMLLIFSTLTMLVIAATRTAAGGIDQSLQGHYKLYNSTLLLVLCIGIINLTSETKPLAITAIKTSLIAAAISLYVAALILFLPTAILQQQQLAEDTRQWLFSHVLQFPETRLYIASPNKRLADAVRTNSYDPWQLLQKTEQPLLTEKASCPTGFQAAPANLKSHKQANAVLLTLNTSEKIPAFYLCSPLQTMRITVMEQSYTENKNGTYSLQLWVPRDKNIKEDSGPWQVYPSE